MDTDSVYLPLAQTELEDCIRPELRAEWEQMRSKDCTYSFTADAVENFFPRSCCDKHKKNMTGESLIFSKRSSGAWKRCVFVVKVTAATTKALTS